VAVKPLETRRLYLQIADKLRARIEEQGFAPNGRLPSERELALMLGVSRPSVREALVALELEGRVEIRMGSGVYICAPSASGSRPNLPPGTEFGESLLEIMTARMVIEGAIAANVAAFGKPKALKERDLRKHGARSGERANSAGGGPRVSSSRGADVRKRCPGAHGTGTFR
jgi:GntR family transcriptional regulator, transcriptional repressor for pyruvate dehydrogenase complex